MRTSTAYLAGAGTVMAAIVVGLGGGLLIGNIASSKSPPQEMTRLEQRMASQRSQSAPAVEPAPSAPAAGTIVAANPPPSSALQSTQATPKPDVQTTLPESEPANVPAPQPPTQTAVVTSVSTAPTVEAAPAQPEAKRQTARAPEESIARSRDADPIRTERRRERRQQWTERRRQRQGQELQEVEQAVREETGPRRAFAAEPVRSEMPLIKLFGSD